jgi:hypothetical protein
MKQNIFESAFGLIGGIFGIILLFTILFIGVIYDTYESAMSSVARSFASALPRRKKAM